MLHPQQDELLLADRLVLIDQHVAARVGVEMFVTRFAGLVAERGRDFGLVGQRRRRVESSATSRKGSGRFAASVKAAKNRDRPARRA